MDWFDLLKQPKLRVGSKITTNVTNIETDEEPCLKKIKEYCANLDISPHLNSSIREINNETIVIKRIIWATSANRVDIPEDVACKALEELSKASFTSLKEFDSTFRGNVVEYNGYTIMIRYYSMPQKKYGLRIGLVLDVSRPDSSGIFIEKVIRVEPYFDSDSAMKTIKESQEQLNKKYMKEVDWR
tara:strand:- start:77 stop:634 length:558 start_codon:yes stop_codon:yes gene_type:complete